MSRFLCRHMAERFHISHSYPETRRTWQFLWRLKCRTRNGDQCCRQQNAGVSMAPNTAESPTRVEVLD